MKLQDLDLMLKTICPQTYENKAPAGVSRFIVGHRYGTQSTCGDDRNLLDLPKIQIDILVHTTQDDLVDDVCSALGKMGLTYSIQDLNLYDEDYNALRTVLQLVVA